MKNRSVRFAFILTVFMCVFLASCRQSARVEYIPTERLELDDIIRLIPPDELVRRISIAQVEYVVFGPNSSRYNAEIDGVAMGLNDLVIDQVTRTLRGNPNFIVRIEGYANPITHDAREQSELLILSEARAEAVAATLRMRGVSRNQIVVIAQGGSRIVSTEHEYWEMNRRVELIVKHIVAD